jgi:hypothetical protein
MSDGNVRITIIRSKMVLICKFIDEIFHFKPNSQETGKTIHMKPKMEFGHIDSTLNVILVL